MNILAIIISNSVTGAVITIVGLLLIAGIIGYVTAWYYAKSVYTPVIKKLEEEKTALLKEVAGLKENVSQLNLKVEKLNETISKLEKEISEKDKEISKLSKEKK